MRGWRAADYGPQTIRLIFDRPQRLNCISLAFEETETERTQEFVLRWSGDGGRSFREIVRQQWNFSPPNSIREVEEYRVELSGVTVLELVIVPGGSRRAPESARVLTRCSSMVTPNTRRARIGEFQLPAQSLCRRRFLPRRQKHIKDVFVEHLGVLLGVLDPRVSKQVKSKQYFSQERKDVAVKLYSNERLSISRLLNCETGATVGFLFSHIAQYRVERVTNPEVRAAHYPLGKHRGMEAELQWRKLLRGQQDCICWTLSHSGIQAKHGHSFSSYSSFC